MQEHIDSVREFHEKFGFYRDMDITKRTAFEDAEFLAHVSHSLASIGDSIHSRIKRTSVGDDRLERMQLMVEELGELGLAMLRRDEVETADAVADLCYVVLGTAVTYGLPLKQLVDEVHASNMSKDVDGAHKPGKGAAFRKPDINGVLQEWKSKK